MSEPTCETCRFWDKHGLAKADDGGLCRRLPPATRGALNDVIGTLLEDFDWDEGGSLADVFNARIEVNLASLACCDLHPAWPLTDADDWCGEHQPRETEGETK